MTPMNSVKFGPCDCSAEQEDWELIRSPTDADAEFRPVYECNTCGETEKLGEANSDVAR